MASSGVPSRDSNSCLPYNKPTRYQHYMSNAAHNIAGILEREQEQSVVYGSIDFGKTVVTHSKYLDLLQKAGNQLKILPHKVII